MGMGSRLEGEAEPYDVLHSEPSFSLSPGCQHEKPHGRWQQGVNLIVKQPALGSAVTKITILLDECNNPVILAKSAGDGHQI